MIYRDTCILKVSASTYSLSHWGVIKQQQYFQLMALAERVAVALHNFSETASPCREQRVLYNCRGKPLHDIMGTCLFAIRLHESLNNWWHDHFYQWMQYRINDWRTPFINDWWEHNTIMNKNTCYGRKRWIHFNYNFVHFATVMQCWHCQY